MSAHAIREIGLPDRALLRAAVEQFVKNEAVPDERVTEFVAAGNTWAFVVVDSVEELLGWVSGSIQLDLERGRRSVMTHLEVLPAHRRGGIGALLLDAAIAHARRSRCSELRLDSDSDGPPTHWHFSKRLGASPNPKKVVRWAT